MLSRKTDKQTKSLQNPENKTSAASLGYTSQGVGSQQQHSRTARKIYVLNAHVFVYTNFKYIYSDGITNLVTYEKPLELFTVDSFMGKQFAILRKQNVPLLPEFFSEKKR